MTQTDGIIRHVHYIDSTINDYTGVRFFFKKPFRKKQNTNKFDLFSVSVM